jgi:hypothetical protein
MHLTIFLCTHNREVLPERTLFSRAAARVEGRRGRGELSRVPPGCLLPRLWRAVTPALPEGFGGGSRFSLRKEVSAAYFAGYISGRIRN